MEELKERTIDLKNIVCIDGTFRYVNHIDKVATIGFGSMHALVDNRRMIRFDKGTLLLMQKRYLDLFLPEEAKLLVDSEQVLFDEIDKIAAFMGVSKIINSRYRYSKYQYHSSWTFLMPVVEKIRREHCLQVILNGDLTVIKLIPRSSIKGFEKISVLANGSLESTVKAVLKYIEWYNANKSNLACQTKNSTTKRLGLA